MHAQESIFIFLTHTSHSAAAVLAALTCSVRSPFLIWGELTKYETLRPRKLLLHKKEINKLAGQTSQQGITLVPLKVYLKNGFAKVLLGVAKGKHEYDKRETIKRRDQEREIRRTLKNYG